MAKKNNPSKNIRVNKITKDNLDKLKAHQRQSYDEVIRKKIGGELEAGLPTIYRGEDGKLKGYEGYDLETIKEVVKCFLEREKQLKEKEQLVNKLEKEFK